MKECLREIFMDCGAEAYHWERDTIDIDSNYLVTLILKRTNSYYSKYQESKLTTKFESKLREELSEIGYSLEKIEIETTKSKGVAMTQNRIYDDKEERIDVNVRNGWITLIEARIEIKKL